MPTEPEKVSTQRRAFLAGSYFTRSGRKQLAAQCVERRQGLSAPVIDHAVCLAWRRMTCRACIDVCSENAVRMRSGFEPLIDASRCSQCGECAAVCPVNAVLGSM